MSEVRPWPEGLDEHQRPILQFFEETLESTTQTSEQFRERARDMRKYAAHTEIRGHRETALALADRYEQAAAAHLVAH